MLVIISDLHLTDGSSGSTISPGAFRLLADRIADLGEGASKRRDGAYRPIERIDLLLLGDVLDVIRSGRWLLAQTRPWDDVSCPRVAATVGQITSDILANNAEALGHLRRLAEHGIRLPAALSNGRPAPDASQQVPVRIHYMVGNHDWFYHLPGELYDRMRRAITRDLGLATPPEVPFPHEAWESNELLQTLRRHRVFARHGDVYDPFNFEGERDASSLGDVLVVELLSRFSAMVEQELGDDLPDSALTGLREIDNVRPLLLVPVWIEGLLERSCPQPALRKQVKRIWDRLAGEYLDHPFVRRRDSWCPVDLVDGLQQALVFSRRLSVGWASWIAAWMCQLRGAQEASYARHALAEQDFRNRRAHHIVYGHTHAPETIPLDASYAEGYVLQQTYFNSGTWRRVYQQTQFAPREHEFIPSDTLTYLAFFKDDERRGRPYETWSGALGIPPTNSIRRRLDLPSTIHAAREPISTPRVPVRAPHFAVPSAPTWIADQSGVG